VLSVDQASRSEELRQPDAPSQESFVVWHSPCVVIRHHATANERVLHLGPQAPKRGSTSLSSRFWSSPAIPFLLIGQVETVLSSVFVFGVHLRRAI
jgi:hypothetical protein